MMRLSSDDIALQNIEQQQLEWGDSRSAYKLFQSFKSVRAFNCFLNDHLHFLYTSQLIINLKFSAMCPTITSQVLYLPSEISLDSPQTGTIDWVIF